MSSRWSWFFGIFTAAALALGIIFFVATQQITGRDWVVLSIGLVLGAMIAALIATFIVHREPPKTASRSSSHPPRTAPATGHPSGVARVSIGVPGQVVHGKLRTSLDIRTRVHNVYWTTTGSPAGELRPGHGESFDVVDADGRHLGQVTALKDGMQLIQHSFEF